MQNMQNFAPYENFLLYGNNFETASHCWQDFSIYHISTATTDMIAECLTVSVFLLVRYGLYGANVCLGMKFKTFSLHKLCILT